MFKKIVVGVDGSDMSKDALRIACDLAQKYDSELIVTHTYEPHFEALPVGAVAGYYAVAALPSEKEVKEKAHRIMDEAQALAKEAGCELTEKHVRGGDPAKEIVRVAEASGADLIVTGRRGLGSVGALVQGSTSQRITHLAKCACLSVV